MRIDCAIFRAVITAKVTPTLKTAQSEASLENKGYRSALADVSLVILRVVYLKSA